MKMGVAAPVDFQELEVAERDSATVEREIQVVESLHYLVQLELV